MFHGRELLAELPLVSDLTSSRPGRALVGGRCGPGLRLSLAWIPVPSSVESPGRWRQPEARCAFLWRLSSFRPLAGFRGGGGGPVSGERRFESLISDSWISSAEAGWRGCGWRNQAGGSWDGVGKGFASVAQFGTMRLALEDCCSLLPGISSVDWHRNLLSFCSLTASCHYLKPRWSFMFVRYRANALRTYLRLMFCLISVFSSDFANIFNLFFVSFCVCQYHGRIRVILKTVLPK